MKSLVCWVGVWAMCLAVPVWAGADTGVTINSNTLQIQEKEGDIRFEGNVKVHMDEIVMSCDLLTVHADNKDPSRILSGEAIGNVVMTKGSDTVQARKAVFDLEAGKVELTGNPRLSREETTIEAERIVYSIEEGAASFVGPVRAFFKSSAD